MAAKTDPLENTTLARILAGSAVAVGVAAFYLSTQRDDPKQLPGVALDSPFLFDLERAIVVAALLAAALIFLVRGWNGYYPSKLSTTGAEYPEREAVEKATAGSADTLEAAEALRQEQLSFASAAREDYNRLKEELNALEQRIPQG